MSEPSVRNYLMFGEEVYRWMRETGGDFFAMEISEDIAPLAIRAGLMVREPYDPEKHGDDVEADPGDEIYAYVHSLRPSTKEDTSE